MYWINQKIWLQGRALRNINGKLKGGRTKIICHSTTQAKRKKIQTFNGGDGSDKVRQECIETSSLWSTLWALCPGTSPDLDEMPRHEAHPCYDVHRELKFASQCDGGLKGINEHFSFLSFSFSSLPGANPRQSRIWKCRGRDLVDR